MSERRDESTLSTADMVSAASGQTATTANAEPRSNGSAAPATAQPRADGTGSHATGSTATAAPARPDSAPLLPGDRAEGYRSRWEEIQAGFVDEPRQAVEQADHLVAEVIKHVAEVFAGERSKLESQWSSGNEVDTEALRQALKRYRSFFERLLST